jgi:methionyl-tRNA formyltransferase
MRLVIIGTGPFGAPAFRGLRDAGHTVAAAVTAPVRPGRRGRPAPISPVRQIALDLDVPIFDPENINGEESLAQLAKCGADLLVVCDYGQILAQQTLATAKLGGINLHGSLLPKYRGAAPVNWALYHGETETGVSVIHMTPQLDAGPVIAQGRTPIDPDETADQLELRLAEMGAELVHSAIKSLQLGSATELPQDARLASKAPRLRKSDGLIDWRRTALQVKNHIRAMQPWPKAFTFWRRTNGRPMRLIVGPVDVAESPAPDAPPGAVVQSAEDRLVVAAGEGAVLIHTLQPAGKRPLPVQEFLRGYPVRTGQLFAAE